MCCSWWSGDRVVRIYGFLAPAAGQGLPSFPGPSFITVGSRRVSLLTSLPESSDHHQIYTVWFCCFNVSFSPLMLRIELRTKHELCNQTIPPPNLMIRVLILLIYRGQAPHHLTLNISCGWVYWHLNVIQFLLSLYYLNIGSWGLIRLVFGPCSQAPGGSVISYYQ